MHKLLVVALPLALLAVGSGCATLSGESKQKVVYHINYNEEAQLKAALGNVQNHINAVCKDKATPCKDLLDMRVVMHGNGVDLLKVANDNLDMQQKIVNLKKQDVAFEVCNNTLVNKKINYKNDLFDVAEKDIVPSGVAEIARLQQQGFVYIKP